MTKGQTIVLFLLFLLLIGAVVVATALVSKMGSESSEPVMTVAVAPPTWTATMLPTDTPTHVPVPTWTNEPTDTPYPTDTPKPTATDTPLPEATSTFALTFTPRPTEDITAGLLLTGNTRLQNPSFENIDSDLIPGWSWWAEDNFAPGGEYDPDSSFDTPLFKQADDPTRRISGPTLQVDAVEHLKFKVHIFQTIVVSPTMRVDFEVSAGAFAELGVIWVNAGLDPDGGPDCAGANWSEPVALDQAQGVRTISAPRVKAGSDGKVTVCLYAETLYAAISNAVFFDDAELTLK